MTKSTQSSKTGSATNKLSDKLADNSLESLMQCEFTARLLKALAHPQRLLILCHLSEQEQTVRDLESLCSSSQSQLSQFLQRMKSESLVDSRREGRFVYYAIKDLRVKQLVRSLKKIFCQ